MRPNFIFIGPDKSGSTWLFKILKEHPYVFVPDAKDIYFFDKHYDKGIDWYLSFFNSCTNDHFKACGEISHDYIFSKDAAQRIKKLFPNIKLITVLRNPIDKAWSLYLFAIRNGITNKSFKDAIKDHPGIIDRSMYGKYLKIYFELFNKNQIGLFLFDKLKVNSVELAKDVFSFLGVEFIENLPYDEKILPASKPRSFMLAKLAKKTANLMRNTGMVSLLGSIKTNKFILNLLYKPYKERPIIPDDIKKHLRSVFEKDIALLSKFTGIDFSYWLRQI